MLTTPLSMRGDTWKVRKGMKTKSGWQHCFEHLIQAWRASEKAKLLTTNVRDNIFASIECPFRPCIASPQKFFHVQQMGQKLLDVPTLDKQFE